MRPAFDSVVVRWATPNLQLRPGNQHVVVLPAQSFDEARFPGSGQVQSTFSHPKNAVALIKCKRTVSCRLGPRVFSGFRGDRDLIPTNLVTGFAPGGGGRCVEPEIQECFLAGLHRKSTGGIEQKPSTLSMFLENDRLRRFAGRCDRPIPLCIGLGNCSMIMSHILSASVCPDCNTSRLTSSTSRYSE